MSKLSLKDDNDNDKSDEKKVSVQTKRAQVTRPCPNSCQSEKETKDERAQKALQRQKDREEVTQKAATGCRGVEVTFKKEDKKEVLERKLLLKLKPYRNHGFRVYWVSSTVAVVLFRTYFYGNFAHKQHTYTHAYNIHMYTLTDSSFH